ncbi:hypothetical protein Plhal304r1_c065g0152941 [Plasmopara halstedii]
MGLERSFWLSSKRSTRYSYSNQKKEFLGCNGLAVIVAAVHFSLKKIASWRAGIHTSYIVQAEIRPSPLLLRQFFLLHLIAW